KWQATLSLETSSLNGLGEFWRHFSHGTVMLTLERSPSNMIASGANDRLALPENAVFPGKCEMVRRTLYPQCKWTCLSEAPKKRRDSARIRSCQSARLRRAAGRGR